eukprot:2928033-Pyramimonas_sp.AAC.1
MAVVSSKSLHKSLFGVTCLEAPMSTSKKVVKVHVGLLAVMAAKMGPAELIAMLNIMHTSTKACIQMLPAREDIAQILIPIKPITFLKGPPPKLPAPPAPSEL